MLQITVKFLAGMRVDMGVSSMTLSLPTNAAMSDLERHLRRIGIDPQANDIIITVNGRGLRQWPPDRQLVPDDVIAVFPLISGGSV
jgi:molybdopterin converting factor small subunit